MQERQRFNIFKAIKNIFRPRVEKKAEKSVKKHATLRSAKEALKGIEALSKAGVSNADIIREHREWLGARK